MAQLVAPLVSIHVVSLPDPYRLPYESASFVWFSINHLGVRPVYHMILIANMICDCRFVLCRLGCTRWGAYWLNVANMIDRPCAAAMRPYVRLLWPLVVLCIGQLGASCGPSWSRVLRWPQHADNDLAETERQLDERPGTVQPDETEQADGPAGQPVPLPTAAGRSQQWPSRTTAWRMGYVSVCEMWGRYRTLK